MIFQCFKRPLDTSTMNEDCPNKVMIVERNLKPQGVELVNPQAVARKAPNDLVELALEIQKADNFIKTNACSKLQMIAEQMKFLREQAQKVLSDAHENLMLHHAACNFVKCPGKIYHLYQRNSGQLYFSMLSPQEWGESNPNQIYKGSFRLEQDQSWTPIYEVNNKNKEITALNECYEMEIKSMFSETNH